MLLPFFLMIKDHRSNV